MTKDVTEIINAFKKGKVILVYHPYEEETAMILSAEKANLKTIEIMKKNASGDISVSIGYSIAKKLGLTVSSNLLDYLSKNVSFINKRKISSYPVILDHTNCKTGSSHKDKILLIEEIIRILKNKQYSKFRNISKYPGHLRFFIASKDLLEERRGHTELSIALTKLAGVYPIVIMCSMRDMKTGGMLSKKEAMEYAKKKDFIFLDQEEIVQYYKKFEKKSNEL